MFGRKKPTKELEPLADLFRELFTPLVKGKHAHKCSCGNRWEHADALAYDPFCDMEAEHTCKNCGTVVWTKDMNYA